LLSRKLFFAFYFVWLFHANNLGHQETGIDKDTFYLSCAKVYTDQWVGNQLGKPQVLRSGGVTMAQELSGARHLEVPDQGQWKKLPIYNTDHIRIVMTPRKKDPGIGILSVDADIK